MLQGGVGCIFLMGIKVESKVLARIGLYSYSIYLFHVFFTASIRTFFMKIGITDINLLFVICLTAGVAGPIVTELLLNKNNFSRMCILGMPTK